jgi:hypothetical protein
MRIDLSRETEAEDLVRFAASIGLVTSRTGTTVTIDEDSEKIAAVVARFLSDSRAPLIPTRLSDGSLALRPHTD